MLAIDKKKDISILSALGANQSLVKSVFLVEGSLISFSGAVIGLILGLLVCLVQQHFGLISMGMQTAVVDAYPVKMQLTDFLYTGVSIVLITIASSYRPAILASRYVSSVHP
ncbi:MAG: FtsX-like permease family protein [Cyclobacteriaceae bacterium]|nr:FtsX-like permease family protein [Cyclobacteriaceae bacterium]